jgi:hypothetical protein
VSRWEGALDAVRAKQVLNGEAVPDAVEPEADAAAVVEVPAPAVRQPAPEVG